MATVKHHPPPPPPPLRASDELRAWLEAGEDTTLGGFLASLGTKSFALPFVLLLGLPALPVPTGGITHVFEAIAVLLALQLIVGRRSMWIPRRWRGIDLSEPRRKRFLDRLLAFLEWLERRSRPRLAWLFDLPLSGVAFGVLAAAGSIAAFLAPPFTGLDTLPALGVVLLSAGYLLEDALFAIAGIAIGAAGALLALLLGSAAFEGVKSLL